KERLHAAGQHLGGHASAVVGDFQAHVAAGAETVHRAVDHQVGLCAQPVARSAGRDPGRTPPRQPAVQPARQLAGAAAAGALAAVARPRSARFAGRYPGVLVRP
ncbi:VENN motif pre-toxin domain-containing protein, partial [Pseudomonas aeruginosa]|nr:VENN motif pre-toxin domain-containing protein [Pseudomonas aeruginosa]